MASACACLVEENPHFFKKSTALTLAFTLMPFGRQAYPERRRAPLSIHDEDNSIRSTEYIWQQPDYPSVQMTISVLQRLNWRTGRTSVNSFP